MGWIVIVIIVIIVIALFSGGRSKGARRNGRTDVSPAPRRSPVRLPQAAGFQGEPPANLGVREDLPLIPLAERLEAAIGSEFAGQLKLRMMAKRPETTESEFAWTWFELKRFFLMNSILHQVPMFSNAVDDVWHEMLMFTRDYEKFGDRFVGYTIHHSPHTEPRPMPNERAWFDWVYAQLFTGTPYGARLWGGFFRSPLAPDRLETLARSSRDELVGTLFNARTAATLPEVSATIDALIERARRQLDDARRSTDRDEYERYSSGYSGIDPLMMLSGMMLFYSVTNPMEYSDVMEEERREEKDGIASCSSAGACSGYSDGDGPNGDDGGWDGGSDGNGSDGGDSGSSSCSSSSCSSSSCSSGCGGGGD